jgi:hypothetical protein
MLETMEQAIAHYAACMKVSKSEAKQDAEQMIRMQMETEGCTREFAEATFIENTEELDCAELDRLDKAAKDCGATKVKARAVDAYGKERKRERKPNEDKRAIIEALFHAMCDFHHAEEECIAAHVDNITTANPERQIDFTLHGVAYSLTLTAHRKPKEGKA